MNKRLEKVLGDVLNSSEKIIFQNEEEFKEFKKKANTAAKKYVDPLGYTSNFNGLKLETPSIYPTAYKITVKIEHDYWRSPSPWKIEGVIQFDLLDIEHFFKNIDKNTAKSFIQNLGSVYSF